MRQPSATISPLSIENRQTVIEETRACINKASELFDLDDKAVDIHFNLKGRAAGMYRVKKGNGLLFSRRLREIRYNPYIFSKYFDDNIATTVPHEVAHFVTDIIYGLKNIKPHGKEWKAVMHAFGADASVTASYDLTGIPQKRMSSYTYRCDCREHQLSSIRHNKIIKNRCQYYCNYCKQTLHYRQEDSTPA
jgi:SprT protein